MVAIPKQEPTTDPIAQVKATVRIEDYAVNKMGYRPMKHRRNEIWFKCPFHQDSTPSFHIRLNEQDFKCFGCDAGGDVIDLEMRATGESNPRVAAENILAEYGRQGFEATTDGRQTINVRAEPVKIRPLLVGEPGSKDKGAVVLSRAAMDWLASRGISAEVARRNGISGRNNAIEFPYVNDGVVVNTQTRTLSAKGFRFEAGKPVIPFGLDDCEGQPEVVIVEGVMDKLAVEEATGRTAVLAMPTANPDSECFALTAAATDAATKIIVAVDNDAPNRQTGVRPGEKLRDELIRRLGADRCWVVDWAPDKDANDVLMRLGDVALLNMIRGAKAMPVEGVFTVDDSWDAIERLYAEGMPAGSSTGWPKLDRHYTVRRKQLTVITGTPGSGKSVWADALLMNLANGPDAWTFAICSPEMQPLERHWAHLISLWTGKPFGNGPTPRLDREDLRQAREFVRDRFFQVLPEEPTVEAVVDRFLWTHRRHGVGGLLLDPWNEMDHSRPNGVTETEYCNQQLRALKRVGWHHDVWVGLIAHPTKMYRNKQDGTYPVPTLYDINGCYSEDTEYLSLDGWKRHDEWKQYDEIACFDLETGKLRWDVPVRKIEYQHEGEMHHWHGRSIDCLVTPDHKMVLQPGWVHEPKNPQDPRIKHRGWQLVASTDVVGNRWRTPIAAGFPEAYTWTGPYAFDGRRFEPVDFIKLIGWWVSEGGLMSHGITLAQAEGPVLDEMRETLTRMGIEFAEYVGGPGGNGGTKNGVHLRIYKRAHPELSNWLVDCCGAKCGEKHLPGHTWALSPKAQGWLFEALMQGDGSIKSGRKVRADSWSYSTSSKRLADDVCRLAVHLGRPARVTVGARAAEHHAERFAVAIGRADRTDMLLEPNRHLTKVHYSGKVWCFDTPTGAFVTRRNGRVCIQGNSAAFANKADAGIVIYRDKGDESKPVEVHVQKIRYHEIGGLTGNDPVLLRHDKTTGRYWETVSW